jgi:hypothetical protein
MDASKNLWGKLPLEEAIRTPLIILREQATLLTQMTNAVLEGVVTNHRVRDASDEFNPFGPRKTFRATLSIEAPALDGYVFQVLQVNYDLALYPVEVNDLVNNKTYECADQDNFEEVMRTILSAEAVLRAVGMLLAQSKSEQVAA